MKEIKKCIFPALNPFANQLESWLCKMAHKGWILIDARGLGIFVFLKGKPSYRKYFFHLGWKGCKFDFDYGMAKTLYQQSSNLRRLNKDCHCIFEVNTQKIDDRFVQYVKLRNQKYIKNYVLLFGFLTICFGVLLVSYIYNSSPVMLFLILIATGMMWSIFAIVMLLVGSRS